MQDTIIQCIKGKAPVVPAAFPRNRAKTTQDPKTRDSTHISTESLEIRQLTVGHGIYSVRGPERRTTSVPMLPLQGAWLERAGFLVGRTVKVLVSSGRLIIEAAEPERVSNAEALERIAQVSAKAECRNAISTRSCVA